MRIKNLYAFYNVLLEMPQEEFSHHVNESKNDFKNWIFHVIADEDLAARLSLLSKKEEILVVLEQRIGQYKSAQSMHAAAHALLEGVVGQEAAQAGAEKLLERSAKEFQSRTYAARSVEKADDKKSEEKPERKEAKASAKAAKRAKPDEKKRNSQGSSPSLLESEIRSILDRSGKEKSAVIPFESSTSTRSANGASNAEDSTSQEHIHHPGHEGLVKQEQIRFLMRGIALGVLCGIIFAKLFL